jgi:hypothetical protein
MSIVALTLPYLVLNPYALIEEANGFFFSSTLSHIYAFLYLFLQIGSLKQA